MDRYFGQVQQHIQSRFQIPSFLNNASLSGQADIKIDRRGFVIFRAIFKSSGNNIFDNAILTAIDNSSPLPEPPPRLQGRLENSGFRLGFPE
ncbi:MAG: TonB C-terminal domain-containing protein [Bdellovibrionales bacterium]